MESYKFSVIIPHFSSDGNVGDLTRLLSSIPDTKSIQVLVVDNSIEPIPGDLFKERNNTEILYSPNERFAGGARNVGIERAEGKWLVFADADDYFSEDAFDIFNDYYETDADVIYFCADGIYPETGEKSNSADLYTNLVKEYISDKRNETDIRISFHVPWAKMVNREYVCKGGYKFDEVIANNDDYFAMLVGYYANKIEAIDRIVYYYTVTYGSLTKRRSYKVLKARLGVILRKNKFLREHGLSRYQGSLMFLLSEILKVGFIPFIKSLGLILKYHQNPFVGCSHWMKTLKKSRLLEKKNKQYITKD